MNNYIKILMLLNSSSPDKNGKCSIKCKSMFNKEGKEFSTGLCVNPKYWNAQKQKVLDDTEQRDYLNKQLSLIINKINQALLVVKWYQGCTFLFCL